MGWQHKHGGGRSPHPGTDIIPPTPQARTDEGDIVCPLPLAELGDARDKLNTKPLDLTPAERGTA